MDEAKQRQLLKAIMTEVTLGSIGNVSCMDTKGWIPLEIMAQFLKTDKATILHCLAESKFCHLWQIATADTQLNLDTYNKLPNSRKVFAERTALVEIAVANTPTNMILFIRWLGYSAIPWRKPSHIWFPFTPDESLNDDCLLYTSPSPRDRG